MRETGGGEAILELSWRAQTSPGSERRQITRDDQQPPSSGKFGLFQQPPRGLQLVQNDFHFPQAKFHPIKARIVELVPLLVSKILSSRGPPLPGPPGPGATRPSRPTQWTPLRRKPAESPRFGRPGNFCSTRTTLMPYVGGPTAFRWGPRRIRIRLLPGRVHAAGTTRP